MRCSPLEKGLRTCTSHWPAKQVFPEAQLSHFACRATSVGTGSKLVSGRGSMLKGSSFMKIPGVSLWGLVVSCSNIFMFKHAYCLFLSCMFLRLEIERCRVCRENWSSTPADTRGTTWDTWSACVGLDACRWPVSVCLQR